MIDLSGCQFALSPGNQLPVLSFFPGFFVQAMQQIKVDFMGPETL